MKVEAWHTLVHVCQQWRIVVFGSPRRLNLRLYSFIAQPKHENLWMSGQHCLSSFKEFSTTAEAIVPDSFLGGSAPRLRDLFLEGMPFPGLPKLLLSAPNVTYLSLFDIPFSGYFSPKAIATALSMLTSLRLLHLAFESPRSFPVWDSRHPLPLTRSILPDLSMLTFHGVHEYLEDLIAFIDAPQLTFLSIFLFNEIEFQVGTQFIRLIRGTQIWKALKGASITFNTSDATFLLSDRSPPLNGYSFEGFEVKISCTVSDWQVLSLGQFCNSCLPPLSALEDLYIYEDSKSLLYWRDNIENILWLDLLRPFWGVKRLHLPEKFGLRIGPALEELVGRLGAERWKFCPPCKKNSWRDSHHRDLPRKGL